MLDWFVYLLPVEAKDEEEGVGGSGDNALLCGTIGGANLRHELFLAKV